MSQKRIIDWFLTPRGKEFSFLCAGGVMTTVLLGNVLPQTVFLFKYRDTVRLYSKGFSVLVPETIQKRFSETIDLLKIEPHEKPNFRPFMVTGFDVFSMGTFGRFGVNIGIPVNFIYDKVEDIDKSRIKVNLESVVWESDAGKHLLNALVLPEKAQMYAMAREIKIRSSYKFFFDTFYAGAACFFTYGFSQYLNRTFDLYSKPRPIRIIGYILVTLLNLGNYCMAKDFTQIYYEKKIDEDLIKINPIFAEGGKDFYTKILERNKALRVLMGKSGEKTYSVLGNENYYIRNKHMPLVHRKQLFEDKEKLTEKKTLETEQLPS